MRVTSTGRPPARMGSVVEVASAVSTSQAITAEVKPCANRSFGCAFGRVGEHLKGAAPFVGMSGHAGAIIAHEHDLPGRAPLRSAVTGLPNHGVAGWTHGRRSHRTLRRAPEATEDRAVT